MKIAKKVLAVVMAVAMIAALSAMAFAADSKATVALTAGEPEDGIVSVTVSLKDAEGFKSGDATLTFDPTVLEFVPASKKSDATPCKEFTALGSAGNNSMVQPNAKEAANGKLILGILVADQLSDLADWGVEGDVNNFGVCVLKFKVLKADVEASVAVEGKMEVGDNANVTFNNTYVIAKASAPVETKPVEVATTAVESDTKASNPPTDDKTTGDNMALAAAAGVVVLAGAAFIISKKRK